MSSDCFGSAARPRAIQGPRRASESALSAQIPRAGVSPSEGTTSQTRSPPLPLTRYVPDGVDTTSSPSALRQRTASSTLFSGTEKAHRNVGSSSGLPGPSATATSSELERTTALSLISASTIDRTLGESLNSRSIELALLSRLLSLATTIRVGGLWAGESAAPGSGAATAGAGACGEADGATAADGGAPPQANTVTRSEARR